MSNELQIFNNEEFGKIATIDIDGKLYFAATSVARALGYARPADAIMSHCKGSVNHRVLTNGGKQDAKFIPEGDVYRLIIRSNLPNADRFERWVFDEVIPQIRKTGGYQLPQTYSEALRALADKVDENQCMSREIEEMKPKVSYVDEIINKNGDLSISQIAQDYGMTGQDLNEILKRLNVQYKNNGQWLLRKKYQGKGYVNNHTVPINNNNNKVIMHTYWTQKGRLFIYQFLKDNNIYPCDEKEGN